MSIIENIFANKVEYRMCLHLIRILGIKLIREQKKWTNLFSSLEKQYYTQADYGPNIEGDTQKTKKKKKNKHHIL